MLEVTADWAKKWSLVVLVNLHHFRYLFHNRRNRNVHDLHLNPLREELPRDHWNAFQSAPGSEGLARAQFVQRCRTLFLSSNLLLMDLVAPGRSRLVHEGKEPTTCEAEASAARKEN